MVRTCSQQSFATPPDSLQSRDSEPHGPWGQGLFVLFTSDPEPHQTHSGHSVLEEGVDGCSAQKDGGTKNEAVTHSECTGGKPDQALGPAFEFYET